MFEEIAAIYPCQDEVSLDHLAVMVCSVIYGEIVMARAVGEPQLTARQVWMLRSYVKVLFSPRS